MNKHYFFLALLVMLTPCAPTKNMHAQNKSTGHTHHHHSPRLTVIIVVDQLTSRILQAASPYLTGGIHLLLHKGAVYTNAYHEHGIPLTATGHSALSTGTFAAHHGIVGNSWINSKLEEIASDHDTAINARVLHPAGGTYQESKSPINIMVDGLSDQFILFQGACQERAAYAISIKSRAAIAMAGKLGKAIWFDEKSGMFTSSKYYFENLPNWLQDYNSTLACTLSEGLFWHRAYPHARRDHMYQLFDYYYQNNHTSMIDKDVILGTDSNAPYKTFTYTPQAICSIFDLGKACIDQHVCNRRRNKHLLLWLSISSIDLLGHEVGQESKDVIDLIYHLDKLLKPFILYAQRSVGKKNALFVLTSDHAVKPIIDNTDVAKKIGQKHICSKQLITALNNHIDNRHGIKNLAFICLNSQIYFDTKLFADIPHSIQALIMQDALTFLRAYDGIKNAWDYASMNTSAHLLSHDAQLYAQQFYPDRSGHIVLQPHPYVSISPYQEGTNHLSPYEYDRHVPLIVYQRTRIELKTIHDHVTIPQVPATIAELLGIPKPSMAYATILPGIYPRRKYWVC